MKQDKLIHQEDRTLKFIVVKALCLRWLAFYFTLLISLDPLYYYFIGFLKSLLGGWQGMTSLCWKYTEQHEYLIKIVLHST